MSKVSVGRTRGGTIRFENKQQALDSPILPRARKDVEFSQSTTLNIVKHSQVEDDSDKEEDASSVVKHNYFAFGGSCQGWRREMEDALVVFPLTSAATSKLSHQHPGAFSLLLDGHRGRTTVELVAQLLPEYLARCVEKIGPVEADEVTCFNHAIELPVTNALAEARYKAFVEAFVQVDQEVLDRQGGISKYLVHKGPATIPHAPLCTSPSSGLSKPETPKKGWVTLSGRAPSGRRRLSVSHSYQDPIFHNQLFQDTESSAENPQRRLSMSSGFGVFTQSEDEGADEVKLEDSFDIPIATKTMQPSVEDVAITLALCNDEIEESLSAVVSKSAPASAGATAAAVMVDGDTITVAGLGDCEVFLIERRADRSRTEEDDNLVSTSYGFPSICRHSTLVVLPTGIQITKLCENHRLSNAKESRRLLHLFGPNIVRPMNALPPPPARRLSLTGEDAAPSIAPNARVRGKLAVTRAFGDYDIKLTVSDAGCGRMLRDGTMLEPQRAEDTRIADKEPLISPLVLSNVPEVHTYKRGAPLPHDGSASTRDEYTVEHYDLVVVGCDGVWELESIAQVAERADEALQPILRARSQPDVSEQTWWHTLESAMHTVITETLQNSIAMSCPPDGKTPGGDNVSLLMTLLL